MIECGLCGTGVDSRSLRLVESTVAQHLRKVLRIHEHGVSNRAVFERAELGPRFVLERRLASQCARIENTESASVVAGLCGRATQVLEFYRRILETDGSALTPVSISTGVPCPVCGVYFDSEAGVALHIQKRHAEVHQGAKTPFDRAKHCVDGIPKCVFCLAVLGDMQAMEKHIAAGGCAVIKQAIAAGEHIEDLRLRLLAARSDATSLASTSGIGRSPGTLSRGALVFLDHSPRVIVRDHAASILSWRPCCMLCGQRMVDVRRVKTHWQAVHKVEWSKYSPTARQHCNTLSKAVQRPCQFCKSNAKDSYIHAAQCPMLFQALMIHELRASSAAPASQADPRPTLPRRSEQVAKYKSFCLSSTPLGMAFRRAGSSASRLHSVASESLQPQAVLADVNTEVKGNCATKRQSQLGMFFRPTVALPGRAAVEGGLWSLRLRLHNPHSLCYLNAGVLSLVHFLEVAQSGDYSALVQVCKQSQSSDRVLSLSMQLVVRSLFRGWRFTNVQRDCAELLTQAVSQRVGSWSEWEQRDQHDAVRDVGAILLRIPTEHEISLQELVNQWINDDGRKHLTSIRPLMIQLGRSTEYGKNHASVLFADQIYLPVLTGNGVERRQFQAVSVCCAWENMLPLDTTGLC